jgi:hypothetical protein
MTMIEAAEAYERARDNYRESKPRLRWRHNWIAQAYEVRSGGVCMYGVDYKLGHRVKERALMEFAIRPMAGSCPSHYELESLPCNT